MKLVTHCYTGPAPTPHQKLLGCCVVCNDDATRIMMYSPITKITSYQWTVLIAEERHHYMKQSSLNHGMLFRSC